MTHPGSIVASRGAVSEVGAAPMPRSRATFSALIEEHYLVLRRIASRALAHRSKGVDAASPTSLVAEAVRRLMSQRHMPASEDHLRGLATVFIARVLADRFRARRRIKRGSGEAPRSLSIASIANEATTLDERDATTVDQEALLRAIEELATSKPRAMEVVTLHLIGGVSMARTAELLGIGARTAFRDLHEGRAALAAHLGATER